MVDTQVFYERLTAKVHKVAYAYFGCVYANYI